MSSLRRSANGWTVLELGELASTSSSSVNPADHPEKEYTYVALENIEQGAGRLVDVAPTFGRNIASAKTRFARGDLLYGRLRPYLQKVVVAPWAGIASTDIIPLTPSPLIDGDYLREFLLSPMHLEYVNELTSGARMPRIRTKDLLSSPVPVPPLDQQRLIAQALTVFRYRVDKARKMIDELLELFHAQKQYIMAAGHDGRLTSTFRKTISASEIGPMLLSRVLHLRTRTWEQAELRRLGHDHPSVTSERLAERYPQPARFDAIELPQLPNTWCWASLSQLSSAADPIAYGVVQPGSEWPDGVPLVRVQDIEDLVIRFDNLRRISPEVAASYSRTQLKGGEILVSLVGTIGKVAVVPNSLAGANVARAVARITPADQSIPSKWIAHALLTPRLQEWMISGSREVARKTLNLSTLEQAAIPLPPVDEMLEIIRVQSHALKVLNGFEETASEISSALSHLLANAIRGIFTQDVELYAPDEETLRVAEAARTTNIMKDAESPSSLPIVSATRPRRVRSRAKRALSDVLFEHPDGLDPFLLLEKAGYSLEEVENFYEALALAINAEEIEELRPDAASVRLKGVENAH